MTQANEQQQRITQLHELIKDIEIAMLTTAERDGTLRSRPMVSQRTEFDGTLWFFTQENTPKVTDIRQDHHVNISYAAPNKRRYVSISGMAQIVHDRQKMKQLWHPSYKQWFPNGLDDPSLALLKVNVTQAEYWDEAANAVGQQIDFVKSVARGEEHERG